MWRRLFWWTTERPAVLPWAVLFSVVLMLMGEPARQSISAFAVEHIYAPFFAMKHRISASARVFDENQNLRRQLAEVSVINQRLREDGAENARLRQLLKLSPPWRAYAHAAEVVAPTSPGSGTMWIDTGPYDTIRAGWPVATEDGLVGKIIEVRGHLSRVRTLWDRVSRVAAYSLKSRAAGVIAWDAGQNLQFTYVLPHADVQPGDSVISSGWGGVFPKGLHIGTIASVDTIPGEAFLAIAVRPAVHSGQLEQVFVIEPVDEDPGAEPEGDTP